MTSTTEPAATPHWADASNFVFVPIDKAAKPITGRPAVYVNYYWLVDDQDRIAFYNPIDPQTGQRRDRHNVGAAQANTSPGISKLLGFDYPWCAGERLVPLVFRPDRGPYLATS